MWLIAPYFLSFLCLSWDQLNEDRWPGAWMSIWINMSVTFQLMAYVFPNTCFSKLVQFIHSGNHTAVRVCFLTFVYVYASVSCNTYQRPCPWCPLPSQMDCYWPCLCTAYVRLNSHYYRSSYWIITNRGGNCNVIVTKSTVSYFVFYLETVL